MRTEWICGDNANRIQERVNEFCSDPERIIRFTQTSISQGQNADGEESLTFLAVIYYDTFNELKARKEGNK